MSSNPSTFNPLERAVLDVIIGMHPAYQPALEAQLAGATVVQRENTGAGFYTSFRVKQAGSEATSGGRTRKGPTAVVRGLQHGMGFVLWLKDGFADCLEGYSFDESTAAIQFDNVAFELVLKDH